MCLLFICFPALADWRHDRGELEKQIENNHKRAIALSRCMSVSTEPAKLMKLSQELMVEIKIITDASLPFLLREDNPEKYVRSHIESIVNTLGKYVFFYWVYTAQLKYGDEVQYKELTKLYGLKEKFYLSGDPSPAFLYGQLFLGTTYESWKNSLLQNEFIKMNCDLLIR